MTQFRFAVVRRAQLLSCLISLGTVPAARADSAVEPDPLVRTAPATAPFEWNAASVAVHANQATTSTLCIFCADYWQLLKGDVADVMTSPVRWDSADWRSAGIKSLAIVGSIAVLDSRVRSYVDDHSGHTGDRVADAFEPFGRQYAALAIGGFLAGGALAHAPTAKAVAVDGLTATIIAAGLVTPGLKLVAGRSRPRAEQGAHDFSPFNGGYSFPSGHTTAAFSVAASIAEHYDSPWIKGLSYGLASMVAYARLEKDAHYLGDVAAGVMIGVGVAHSVADLDRAKRAPVELRPAVDPAHRGLALGVTVAMRR